MTVERDRRRVLHVPGVSERRFRKIIGKTRRYGRAHPIEVLADLRAGSLVGLDRYLRQNRGIGDREVALELRKMISGTAARAKFRLAVIDHPQAERRKGGRPRSRSGPPTPDQFLIAMELEREKEPNSVEAAAMTIAERHGISARSVFAYAEKVARYERAQRTLRERKLAMERYAAALSPNNES